MNITFFSSVSTREKVFNCIPEIKKHNVKFFKLNESDRLLSDGFDTDLLFTEFKAYYERRCRITGY